MRGTFVFCLQFTRVRFRIYPYGMMRGGLSLAKNDLPRRFYAVLRENGWESQTPLLLAVSGGSDSMSLFYLALLTLDPSKIAVVHMDHGLRDSAVRDREFVEEICAETGVRCLIEHRDVLQLKMKGESVEAAGRRLRYEFYEQAREKLGCRLVALGHTRDDLAESTLMNIARGCGLRGLAGMPRQRGVFIRPLLDFYREELREFMRRRGWIWVEDESNELNIYLRNRVRHAVMPILRREINTSTMEHLAALADEALDWRASQDAESRKIFRELHVSDRPWPEMDVKKLRRLDDFQRIELFRWLGRELSLRSLSRGRTLELNRLVVDSGRWIFQWGSTVDVTAEGGTLRFHPAAEKKSPSVILDFGTSVRWGGWDVSCSEGHEICSSDFIFACAADPSQPVILKINPDGHVWNDPFPVVEQPEIFQAVKKRSGWEILTRGVKYKRVFQILFIPRTGVWRKNLWN